MILIYSKHLLFFFFDSAFLRRSAKSKCKSEGAPRQSAKVKCKSKVFAAPKCKSEVLKLSLRGRSRLIHRLSTSLMGPQSDICPLLCELGPAAAIVSTYYHAKTIKNPLSRVWVIFLERGQLLLYLLFQVSSTQIF